MATENAKTDSLESEALSARPSGGLKAYWERMGYPSTGPSFPCRCEDVYGPRENRSYPTKQQIQDRLQQLQALSAQQGPPPQT